jgi:hypothetical protein
MLPQKFIERGAAWEAFTYPILSTGGGTQGEYQLRIPQLGQYKQAGRAPKKQKALIPRDYVLKFLNGAALESEVKL